MTRPTTLAAENRDLPESHMPPPPSCSCGDITAPGVVHRTAGPCYHKDETMENLESAIRAAINRHSAENGSNTPDWILAQYLLDCLDAWNKASRAREKWYGVEHAPGRMADIQ